MRKRTYYLTLSVMMLVLTACGIHNNDYTYATQMPAATQQQYPPEAAAYQQPDIAFGQEEFPTVYSLNPFAEPLIEYLVGGVDADSGSHIQISRRTFWADIIGDNNQGVIAIRHVPLDEPWYIDGIRQPTNVRTQARIFYFTGKELIYKDVDDFREAVVAISQSGRVVIISTRDIDNISFTLLNGATDLTTHTDVLIYWLTLYRELQENGEYNFYSFRGGFAEGFEGERTLISEEEFNVFNARYGLTDWIGWELMNDESEQILTMVFQ